MKNSKIALLIVVAFATSVGISQAQTTLLVRFPLTDTDGGTSFASDPAGQANGFSMTTYTKGGVPGTFQGTPGGGVSGLGVALDFSTNSDFTTVGEGGATGAGPVGAVTNAALNFGFVSAFTATVWFKAVTNMPSTNTTGNWDLGPRIFILGTAGATDKGIANTIGFFYQQWNCLAYSIGTSEIALPCFTSPTVVTTNSTNSAITYTNAYVPTNQWLFYAITYDGGNVVTVYSGTDQSTVTTVLATTSTTNVLTAAQVTAEGAFIGSDALATTPQNIGPGAAGMNPTTLAFFANGANNSVLYIGNRQNRARTLDGWINDFRFYSGAVTPSGVEDIRWSALAPTNFTAVPNIGDTQVTLSWNAVAGASGYNLLRGSANGGPYSMVLLNNQNQTSYVDSSITPTGNYYYVVQAVDANGDLTTGPNSVQKAYLGSPPPAVPGNFTATAENSQVGLNWNASVGSPAAATYTVSRATASGQESFLQTVTAPATTYTDTNVVNGVKYYYKVSATSAAGTPSANSSEANATPFGPPEAPNASAASTGLAITVSWTDLNPPSIQAVDSFIILRSVNGGPFSQIATPGVGTSSYNDTGLTVGDTYSYEVEAVNNNGTSPPSSATASIQITQQVTIQDIAEQTVRAAADHAGVVNDNGSGTIPGIGAANAVGFLRVKWQADGNPAPGVDTTSCAKTYLRWTFASNPPPDTNSDLTLTWTTDAAGVPTTMTLWSLDQPYRFVTGVPAPPGDGSTFVPPGGPTTGVTWDNAQANDTNYNPINLTGTFQMLTNGPFTATPVAYFTGTSQVTVPTPVVVIPAPWGNLIHSNELVFCVGGTNNFLSQASAGYRIANNSPALIYNQILGTTPPSISLIPNISLNINQTSSTINFTMTDPDGPGGSANGLAAATVAVLNDTTGGTTVTPPSVGGATQQLSVTAGPTSGTASVKVTITDEHGDLAQRTFTVTVLPPIAISTPAPTNTLASTPVVVPFTVADNLLNEPQNQLTMNATVDAQSTAVLATAVAAAVGGNNWTVTVTPAGNTNGIGFVDLSVTDTGGNTARTAIAVMVQASPETVFSETFNYTDVSSLLLENGSALGVPPAVNSGVWNGIGPSGPILSVSGNSLNLNVNANGEEGYANLLGGPYAPGHGYVIYTTFQANWSAFTGFTWLSLGEFSGVGGFQYAGVGNIPDVAQDGGFNATIVNGPGGTVATNPATLTPGTTYNIATRYDVDRAKATLWINAANEADPTATNVTATDLQAPAQISDITLNQNGAAGDATVVLNDLTVTLVLRPLINSISVVGGNVQIIFTAGVNDTPSTFSVNSTTDLTIPFGAASPTIISLGGGVFKATLPVSGNRSFYRVMRQPFVFSY